LVGLIVLFKWALKKRVMFLVGSNYINTEDNYGCLIEFLSQISTFLILLISVFQGVLGTRFGPLELKIGSLESEKIMIGSLESKKIVSLESEKLGPYKFLSGT